MSEPFEDEKYKSLFRRLEELVNDFTSLVNEEEEATAIPVAHVLLIGCDGYESTDTGVLIFPAGGFQASWKTAGLTHTADACLMEKDHEE